MIEQVLRWAFPPRRRAVDLAEVSVDRGRGVVRASSDPGRLTLTVSYGYFSDGSRYGGGEIELEGAGPHRVQAVREEPWGPHRWWLHRRRRPKTARSSVTLWGGRDGVFVPAGHPLRSDDGTVYRSTRPTRCAGPSTTIAVVAYAGWALTWRRAVWWPVVNRLHRAFAQRR